MKLPKGKSERWKFHIIIFGVIVAITIILTPIWSLFSGNVREVSAIVWLFGLVALVFFVWIFLSKSWKHPKWYVKLYTAVCLIWEIFCALVLLATFMTGGSYGLGSAWSLFGSRDPFIVTLQTFVLAFPPLIPTWYWYYKEYGKGEEPKRKEPKAWELEDQLKELDRLLARATEMKPLKKFEEWYERRHLIVKGILIGLPIIPFLVSCWLMFAALYSGAGLDLFSLIFVPFSITGFVILFILLSIHERHKKLAEGVASLLSIPFVFWVFIVFMFILLYWQISLLLLTSVGATFVVWKLWGKRKWELKKRRKALARELEDQLKELDERLSFGRITQKEYEQRKKLLEKSEK